MIHILLHFIVPALAVIIFYRARWKWAVFIMLITLLVDLDHLFADPIYDPQRCSIGFHPLHTLPAILVYGMMFLLPFGISNNLSSEKFQSYSETVHLAGLGLLIHMALDGLDCFW